MHHNPDGLIGVCGLITATIFTFFAKFNIGVTIADVTNFRLNISLSDLSAIFAMIAAAATAAYYITKTVLLIKNKNRNNDTMAP